MDNMETYVNSRITMVDEIIARLDDHTNDFLEHRQNDFISLAISAEGLRQAVMVADAYPILFAAHECLKAYDARLPEWASLAPERLDEDLRAAMRELESWGKQRPSQRDRDAGEDAVSNIDSILRVAAASVRAGTISRHRACCLGAVAVLAAATIAPTVPELWNYAEERSSVLGPDPMIPNLYQWIEELAELSEHRSRLYDAVMKG